MIVEQYKVYGNDFKIWLRGRLSVLRNEPAHNASLLNVWVSRYATCVSTFACNRQAAYAHFAPSNSAKVRVGPE